MWASEPLPAPATDATQNGPPDLPSPEWRLLLRPREFADPTTAGVGPFRPWVCASEAERAAFVACWQYDFEMRLPE